MQPDKSQLYTIPAPVGGWNARDALPAMDPRDALRLDNVFPETNLCRVIADGKVTDEVTYASGGTFGTFAEYYPDTGNSFGIIADGVRFRVVTSGGTLVGAERLHGGGTRWESVNFGGSIIFVCGGFAPEAYNGTTWSNPTYTGITNPIELAHVDAYKSRLYFVQRNSLKMWYGGVRNISGALTEYDISGIVRRGGSIVFAGSVTKDIGSGLNDIFIICTDQGEVLFFTGDNPGATNWQISGRAYIGEPLGKRAFCAFRSDLLIATTEGIVSASRLVQAGSASEYLTDKIQTAYNDAAKAATSFDGWELKYWPTGHMLILNVPQAYPTDVHQYVMNTYTGAWCRFKGIQATSFCNIGSKLFYVRREANATPKHSICEFDQGAAPPADIEIQGAFIPLADEASIKQVKRIRPFWNAQRGFGYYLQCLVDFEERNLDNLVRATGTQSTPWGSPWGSPWVQGTQTNPSFYSVDSRTGTFFSYKIKTSRVDGATNTAPVGAKLSAVSFIYEAGGIA